MEGVEASGKGCNDDTRLVITSQQKFSDETQEETKLVAAKQKEFDNDVREGGQLVAGQPKVPVEDSQEGIELVAPFLKDLNGNLQEGTKAVVASKPKLSDDISEGTDIVIVLHEELSNNAQEGTVMVEASQKEPVEDTPEKIEQVLASENQPKNDRQDVTKLLGASGQGLNNGIRAGTEHFAASQEEAKNYTEEPSVLKVATHKDLIDDTQEEIKLVLALQQEVDVHTQEGPELVATSQNEQVSDSQGSIELLEASQTEVVKVTQERIEQKAASQNETSNDLQDGAELVVAPETEFIDDKEGTDQMAASQKELSIDSGEVAELGVALQQQPLGDDTQETPQLWGASPKELSNNLQAGAELVVDLPRKNSKDGEDGTELVAASEKEQNNDPQQGAELMLAPQQQLSSHTKEGGDRMVASAKEPNIDTREGSQLVETFQLQVELSEDIQLGTELGTASQLEPSKELPDGAMLVVASQQELNDYTQEKTKLMADSQQEFKGDPQDSPVLVLPFDKEPSKKCQERTELVDSFPKEIIDDAQAATKSVVPSEMETLQDCQQQTELVAASQKELEEPRSTSRSEEATFVKNVVSVEKATLMMTVIPVDNPVSGIASEVLSEQSVVDRSATEVTVSRGRTMKWKDMARRKLHSPAGTAAEHRQAVQPAVLKKSKPRRNLSNRAHSQEQAVPARRPSSITHDPIQQVPIPHSSPNIRNNLEAQSSSSPALTLSPTISPHRQQLPCSQVSPLRFDELLQATNSVAWRPVVDCDPRGRPGSELPHFSSGKPPRPPSQSSSGGVKRSLPSEFINPSIVQQNRTEGYFHLSPYLNEANDGTVQGVNLSGVNSPPLAYRQLETPPTSLSARGFENMPPPNRQSGGPSSLPVPERDLSDNSDLPSPLSKKQKRNSGPTPQQKRRNLHKRRLQQLRIQVLKKLKLWGRESNMIPVGFQPPHTNEADAIRQSNDEQKRLIMSEGQRDAFVQNMVESSRKDPQMRATFLAAVKQIANLGVLHSSARLLIHSDSSGKSQDVFQASKQLSMAPEENSSAAVHLYKSVDKLHKQGDMAMRNLPPIDGSSMCSLGKTSAGAWEVVFPNLGPQKRVRRQMDDKLDDTLDEPLRPSK